MEQSFYRVANSHSVKKFPTFHGTQKCIAVFITASRSSLLRATGFHSATSHPISIRTLHFVKVKVVPVL
jgi:hypothetical protein